MLHIKRTLSKVLVLLLAAMVIAPATAQVRRKSTTRRSTTRTTTTQRAKTATPATSGKFTVYKFRNEIVRIFNAKDYIYVIEGQKDDKSGNAVKAISKATGAVSTLIPARAWWYEGEERPYIRRLGVIGNKVYIFTCPLHKNGYDQDFHKAYVSTITQCADASQWKVAGFNWNLEIKQPCSLSPDGKTLAIYAGTQPGFDGIHGDMYIVSEDGSTRTLAKEVPIGEYENQIELSRGYFLSNYNYVHAIGKSTDKYTTTCTQYINSSGQIKAANWRKSFVSDDDILYAYNNRGVWSIPASMQGEFAAYLSVAPTEKTYLEDIAVNKKGDILAECSNTDGAYHLFRKGETTSTSLGRYYLTTDLRDPDLSFEYYTFSKRGINGSSTLTTDRLDNFLLNDDTFVVIYNPDGINGYSTTKGKFITISD